jgi:DNA-binding LacI/PurR family transcriptional regulator
MSLYIDLKDQIIKHILEGVYVSGEAIPTEHVLGEKYGISRVTVRKALDTLKKEGVLTSVQGQGTVIAHRKGGFPSSMDLIALLAAVHNPFFASFMEHFERAAEENGSLVLFKQDFRGQAFQSDELFYRFIKKNIRNVVLWPQTDQIDLKLLKQLRLTGMNLVFFDQRIETDLADVVCVDNEHAVTALYQEMRTITSDSIMFLGYHGIALPSESSREQAFQMLHGGNGEIHTITWGGDVEAETTHLLSRLHQENRMPSGIMCCNGPIGVATSKFLRSHGITDTLVGAIDYMPEMASYPMIAYKQPMKELAEKSYERLITQTEQGELWEACTFQLQGEVVRLHI